MSPCSETSVGQVCPTYPLLPPRSACDTIAGRTADARSFVDYLQSLRASVKQGDILVMFAALYDRLQDPSLR